MNISPGATPLPTIAPRYAPFLRLAHWVTFALVLLAYVAVNAHEFFPRGSPARVFSLESHYLLGMLVLLLTLPRIVVRLRQGQPPVTPRLGVAERLAAGTAHLALFLFLVVQPALGIAGRLLAGKGIGLPLTEWAIPSFGLSDPVLSRSLTHLHESIGVAFYYVIGLHILAALWHWRVRRDDTLQRML